MAEITPEREAKLRASIEEGALRCGDFPDVLAVFDALAAERQARQAAEWERDDLRSTLPDHAGHGDKKAQSLAWSAVWNALEKVGLLTFIGRLDESGMERAVGFIRKIAAERDATLALLRRLEWSVKARLGEDCPCHSCPQGATMTTEEAEAKLRILLESHTIAYDPLSGKAIRTVLAALADAERRLEAIRADRDPESAQRMIDDLEDDRDAMRKRAEAAERRAEAAGKALADELLAKEGDPPDYGHLNQQGQTVAVQEAVARLNALITDRIVSHESADAIRTVVAAMDAGVRFKAFVHGRLDEGGVPADDPENPHSKAGCRIGARLDLVLKAYCAQRDDPGGYLAVGGFVEQTKEAEAARDAANRRAEEAVAEAAVLREAIGDFKARHGDVCGANVGEECGCGAAVFNKRIAAALASPAPGVSLCPRCEGEREFLYRPGPQQQFVKCDKCAGLGGIGPDGKPAKWWKTPGRELLTEVEALREVVAKARDAVANRCYVADLADVLRKLDALSRKA